MYTSCILLFQLIVCMHDIGMIYTLYIYLIDPSSRCCAHYGKGSGIIRVLTVSCSGHEVKITSCSYTTSSTILDHNLDVGVQCLQGYNI